MTKTPTRICIVGVGLIGGSLGMALRRARAGGKRRFFVTGLGRHRSALLKAKKLGAVDAFATDDHDAAADADIVVICVPVHSIAPVLRRLLPHLKPGAIVTDVGSVKKSVVDAASKALGRRKDVSFVGAHPIAGSEKTGVENARMDLFQNAACVLTKDRASFRALDAVRALWKVAGAKCVLMSADDHDQALAITSHLPHLLAFALFDHVHGVAGNNPVVRSLVAGSFRDMTRIAGADPELWTGIIDENRSQIRQAAAAFLKRLKFLSNAPPAALRRSLSELAQSKSSW